MRRDLYNGANQLLPAFDAGGVLLCPACYYEYTHHGTVSVYDRDEDEPDGLCVRVDWQGVTVTQAEAGNPSGRRHGLRIAVTCELCEVESALVVYQHKGQTFIAWEEPQGTDGGEDHEC